jgi:hypothetical protein
MARGRFGDVIQRQLDLFTREQAELISEVETADEHYHRAGREEAEERYGDYMDLVETATEVLADLRDNYASALDDNIADEYEHEFNRAVLRRFPRFALEIEDT